jgi:hypothetical protein
VASGNRLALAAGLLFFPLTHHLPLDREVLPPGRTLLREQKARD